MKWYLFLILISDTIKELNTVSPNIKNTVGGAAAKMILPVQNLKIFLLKKIKNIK